jgi:O-antigen ligase
VVKILKLSETVFVVLSLLLYSGAIGFFIADTNPIAPIKIVFAYTGHVIAILLIALRWRKVVALVIKEQLLWVVVGLVIASLLWSDVPMFTLEKMLPLVRVTVFGVYFASCYTIKEQMQLLAWTFGIAAVGSFLVCIAVPRYGVVGAGLIVGQEELIHAGAWRGLYVHKTILGGMMSLGALSFLGCACSNYKYRWLMWAGFGFSVFMLLRSTTKAALGILIIILIIFVPFYRSLRWNYNSLFRWLTILLIIGACIILWNWANYENTIFARFGKDITITGRTELWSPLIDKIWDRPWLGYGYETFWGGGWKGKSAYIWRQLKPGFEPPHAHNGFLEVWLDIGLLGLGTLILSMFTVFLRSIIWLRLNKAPEGLVPLTYLTVLILINLTESSLMRPEILWLFYVTVTLSLHRKEEQENYWYFPTDIENIKSLNS